MTPAHYATAAEVRTPGARADLEAARDAAAERIGGLVRDLGGVVDASRDDNADDEHDPEGSTIAFERAQLVALLGHARRRHADLVTALGRVEDGTYGTCESCGRPIAAARLEIRPAASTCADCARARARRR